VTRRLGPRARRRIIAWGAGVAVSAAVLAVGAYAFFHPSGSGRPTAGPRPATGEQSAGIAFGAGPTQVLRTLGAPAAKRSGCWSYPASAHRVGGTYLGKYVDGLRFCFAGGPAGGLAVTTIFEHVVAHRLLNKNWFPGGWTPAVAIEPARTS
jgi:hypothetical protein